MSDERARNALTRVYGRGTDSLTVIAEIDVSADVRASTRDVLDALADALVGAIGDAGVVDAVRLQDPAPPEATALHQAQARLGEAEKLLRTAYKHFHPEDVPLDVLNWLNHRIVRIKHSDLPGSEDRP